MRADVSVIIAAYNVAPWIERAIASVLTQTGVIVEVIVVDDASTDGTWDAIARVDDPRVKSFQLAANSGSSAARNYAIAQASGTWIAVLDGDDMFLPERLQRCLALAKKTKADAVVDNLSVTRAVDGKTFAMFAPERIAVLKTLTVERFIAGNSYFLRGYGLGYVKPIISAKFLQQHGLTYRESIRIGEDYIFLLEALASGARCAVEPNVGYGYTAREGSLSHRLKVEDVARIQAADDQFFASYEVSAAALEHQRQREKNLHGARIYHAMVSALKQRDVQQFARLVARYPAVARHLWMPLWVRLRRFMCR